MGVLSDYNATKADIDLANVANADVKSKVAGSGLLSSTNPANLGTVAAGTGTTAARADHVHAMPTYTDVGAAAATHTHPVLARSHVALTLTDTSTTETQMYSVVVPGGTLGANDSLRVTTMWNVPNSATIKSCRVKFGGQIIQQADVSTSNSWIGQILLSNRNATNAQIGGRVSATSFGTAGSNVLTYTIDTTVNQTLSIHGAWGTAGTGSNSIVLESVLVEVIRG